MLIGLRQCDGGDVVGSPQDGARCAVGAFVACLRDVVPPVVENAAVPVVLAQFHFCPPGFLLVVRAALRAAD